MRPAARACQKKAKQEAKNEAKVKTRTKMCRSTAKTAAKTRPKAAMIGNESDLATRKIDLKLLHISQNGSNLAGSWCGPGRFPLHLTLTLNLLR
jgi:hypothetical protein